MRWAHDLLIDNPPGLLESRHDLKRQLLGASVDHDQRLTGAYTCSNRCLDDQARGVIDLVLFANSSRPQLERGQADGQRVNRGHVAIRLRPHRDLNRRYREPVLQAPALRLQHLDEGGAAGAGA